MPDDRPCMVQLGTGALSLGLVAWVGHRAGLDVVLANRLYGSAQAGRNQMLRDRKEYRLSAIGPGREGEKEEVRIRKLLFMDDEKGKLISRIADPRTMLVTTALKGGVETITDLLARSIEARLATSPCPPLYVVACENTFDSQRLGQLVQASLHERVDLDTFRDHVDFISCMVDRQCNEPFQDPPESGPVVVEVEEYAQWVMERPRLPGGLEDAFRHPAVAKHVLFVRDIRPVQQRKRWLVNATHLTIALNALDAGYLRLDHYLDPPSSLGRQIAEAIMEESVEVFDTVSDRHYNRAELEEYARTTLRRFINHPKLVTEILSRLSGPDRLAEFFRDYNAKVSRSCLQYAEYRGELPFFISRTLWLATRLIAEERWVGH